MRAKGENYKSPRVRNSRPSAATRKMLRKRHRAPICKRARNKESTVDRLESIGKIRRFLHVWEDHTDVDEILEAVKGYGLTFEGDPVQGVRRTRFSNPKDYNILKGLQLILILSI